MTVYGQDGYAVRLEWGPDGVRGLAPRCAVVVVVDILVFTTSVDVALGRGGRVLPLPWRDQRAEEEARRAGAVLARSGLVRTAEGLTADPNVDNYTLRPSSLIALPAGTFLAIASPNGATLCAAAADSGTTVLAGCLRNATSVGAAAAELAGDGPIGVVPAGERWHDTKELGLRPAVEDLLGAGAIVSAISGRDRVGFNVRAAWKHYSALSTGRWQTPVPRRTSGPASASVSPHLSPEAELAALTYAAAGDRIRDLLAGCVSGRELIQAGLPGDVELAGDVDISNVVPILTGGVFEPLGG